MSTPKKSTIEVQGEAITVLSGPDADSISLTDIAKFKNPDHPDDVIRNWLRNRNTVEFLGVWERLHNPGFNPVEFDGIRMPGDRLKRLNQIAIRQMQPLTAPSVAQRLAPPQPDQP